jgi:inhibitor of cysteine peptidase
MRLKIITVLGMIIAMLALSSCLTTSLLFKVDVTCEEFRDKSPDIANEFEIEVGDKIMVKLCSNPSTGFEWDYEMTGDDILKLEDHDFEEPEGDIVGAAGRDVYTFKAIRRGTGGVRMEYSRPWEGGEKAEWTYTMDVTVK